MGQAQNQLIVSWNCLKITFESAANGNGVAGSHPSDFCHPNSKGCSAEQGLGQAGQLLGARFVFFQLWENELCSNPEPGRASLLVPGSSSPLPQPLLLSLNLSVT